MSVQTQNLVQYVNLISRENGLQTTVGFKQ